MDGSGADRSLRQRATGRATPSQIGAFVLVVLLLAVGVVLPAVPSPAAPPGSSAGSASGTGGASNVGGSASLEPAATALPALTESVPANQTLTPVWFNASNFPHSSGITVTWVPSGTKAGSVVTACAGKTSTNGFFPCKYVIAPTAGGNYTFTAKVGTTKSASVRFQVLPTLRPNPTSGVVGAPTSVTGVAFGSTVPPSPGVTAVNVTVTVLFGPVVVCPQVLTNLYGNFTCAFSVPPSSAGNHTVHAFDSASNHQSTVFKVLPRVAVSPSYFPSGIGYGLPGSTVSFTGTGFSANASVNVTWPGGTVCSAPTSPNGGFNCTYTLPPETPRGPFVFTGSDGTNSARRLFDVTYLSSFPLSSPVGANVTFTGGGFTPFSTVTISWGGGTVLTAPTNATGNFASFLFNVPAIPGGTYPFTAVDGAGLWATFGLTVVPALVPSPHDGPAGTVVVWNGTGFAPFSPVTVVWVAGPVCSTTTDAVGNFSCLPFPVPLSTAGGVYNFSATDGALDTASAAFTVTFLSILPLNGPVGTSVTITGGGFTPGQVVTVSIGVKAVCVKSADVNGTIACPLFKIPQAPAGPLTFVANDSLNETTHTPFFVVPTLSVAKPAPVVTPGGTLPPQGPVGTAITFSGTGYGASVSVSVNWFEGTACSNTTSVSGAFNCTFVLPPAPTGLYPFVGVDALSNTAQVVFQLLPQLAATPPGGNAGLSVQLFARGFAAKSAINISSSLALACSGTTDLFGTFGCTYSIPPIAKGNLTFTAFDSGGDQAKLLFPVGPHLTANPSAAKVGTLLAFSGTGFAANSALTLNWSEGTVCRVTTSSVGGFSCGYVLPATSSGRHTFVAADSAKVPNSANATVAVLAAVVANSSFGPPGQAIRFNGTGFTANSTVSVSGFATPVCSGTTGAFGSFVCSGKVPAAPFGNLSFSAIDLADRSAAVGFSVASNLTISPANGSVGSVVLFLGRGFAPASAARVTWAGGTVCSGTTATNGTFSCTTPVPPATGGPHTFQASDAAGNFASAVLNVFTSISAGLTATPSGGPPGTVVSFHGTGFAPGSAVNVTWALGLACAGVSDSSGGFDCTFSVPLSAPGGLYTFTGADSAGNTASATFVVTFLSVEPPRGPVGTNVTFSGGGFTASTTFTITWSGGPVCSGSTTTGGGLGCTFTVPPVAPGTYNFTATDGSSLSATTAFTVAPVLTVSQPRGPVHTNLTFNGTAFAPSSRFNLTYAGGLVCQGTTTGTGTFVCPFPVPPTPGGLYVFSASDGAGNVANATFVVTASMAASPNEGPVGSSVPFAGLGFDANAAVSVNGSSGPGCATITDPNGSFSCAVGIGTEVGGSYLFVGTEGVGAPTATATFTVVANLTVAPTFGPIGSTLQFVATGFAGFSSIAVSGLTGAVCSGSTSFVGSFSCTFAAPTGLLGGNNSFVAEDSLHDQASATLLVVPALSLFPTFGAPGTIVTVSGLGFAPSGPVNVSWTGGDVCAVTANGSGDFACSFQIPIATAGGPYLFAATDGLGNRASATFTVTFLTVTPGQGPVGTLLTLNGGGFGPGAPFAVTGFGTSVCSGTTSSAGTFHCAFVEPSSTLGPHLLTASDGGSTSATATVTVSPSLASSPASGPVGTAVVFTGRGFASGLPVVVNWSSGVACNATSGSDGSFSCGFTIPTVTTGVYRFFAFDSANDNASTTFDVALPATFNVTFEESGLPNGTSWTVSVNGVSMTTNAPSVTFPEPNGAYTFTVRSTGFLANPPSGTVTVAGAPLTESVAFAPSLYAVTFAETGLTGVMWSVTLGATTVSSVGPSLSFSEPNGTYNYTVNPIAGYAVTIRSGQVVVAGSSPASVPVAFSQVDYAVTFSASGLGSGQSWSVSLNGVRASSTTSTITILRPNGTYSYVFSATGYTPSPGGGTVVVNGLPLGPFNVTFSSANFAVTFHESGLTAGATWSVTFNSQQKSTTDTSLVFFSGNGNFTWRSSATGYRAAPSGANLSVQDASPPQVNITFTAITYAVTFTESGLPTGSYWSVGVAGLLPVNQSTKSITVQLANGSYLVAFLPPNGYFPQPSLTIVTVAGLQRTVNVQMVPFSQLVPPPPSTFLGYSDLTGYYILAAIIAGCAGGGGGLGYFLGRRATRKSLAADFL